MVDVDLYTVKRLESGGFEVEFPRAEYLPKVREQIDNDTSSAAVGYCRFGDRAEYSVSDYRQVRLTVPAWAHTPVVTCPHHTRRTASISVGDRSYSRGGTRQQRRLAN